jgi:hypothetical protein
LIPLSSDVLTQTDKKHTSALENKKLSGTYFSCCLPEVSDSVLKYLSFFGKDFDGVFEFFFLNSQVVCFFAELPISSFIRLHVLSQLGNFFSKRLDLTGQDIHVRFQLVVLNPQLVIFRLSSQTEDQSMILRQESMAARDIKTACLDLG